MVSIRHLHCLAITLLIAVTLHDQIVEGEPTCRPLRRLTTARLSALRSSTTSSFNRLPELLTRLWCENDNRSSAAGNYVNMTFLQKVLVYGFATRGDHDWSLWGKREAYVKRFTLTHYSDKAETLQEFQVNTSNTMEFFFVRPVTTDKIRFTIIEAETNAHNNYCWHLDIFGCNAINIPSPTLTPTESCSCTATTVQRYCPTSTVIVAVAAPPLPLPPPSPPPPSPLTHATPTLQQQTGQGSWMIGVAVAVPPTVIVAFLLFALFGAVMWRKRRSTGKKSVRSGTILELPNKELYTMCRHVIASTEGTPVYTESSAQFVSSQEPLVDDSLAYNPVYALATDELHSSSVAGTDIHEFLYQTSPPIIAAPNPSYQQHTVEHEYAYPEVILTPGQSVHVASDSDTNDP